jgi:hypothetical protein
VADEPVFGEFADGADAKCLLEGGRVAAGQPNASSGASASASTSIRWYFLATCSWCSPIVTS